MRPLGFFGEKFGRARLAGDDVELDQLERNAELSKQQPHLVAVAGR